MSYVTVGLLTMIFQQIVYKITCIYITRDVYVSVRM